MRFLFVDSQYPMFDRASADVRMFAIVQLLREQGHECDYFASNISIAETHLGAAEVARYREALHGLGVRTLERTGFEEVLAARRYDAVFFKYFYPAETGVGRVRIWQPWARIVVDSVDLVYARLGAKAELSKLAADYRVAEDTRRRELATYAAADVVLTVTEDEAKVLAHELPGLPIHVIPNIHDIPFQARSETPFPSLLFIGAFTHEPNVDGVLWFVREAWPSVHQAFPAARLRVVGGWPPAEIQALAKDGIEVLGFVPDTLPYLMESWVSVAPLRFGAGMKGKVGEAMAAGVPVLTTSFGAEGFGLTPGEHLLVADDPKAFADAVITLFNDRALRLALGEAGRTFIQRNYSFEAVGARLGLLVDTVEALPNRPDTLGRRLYRIGRRVSLAFHRHLGWRIHKQQ